MGNSGVAADVSRPVPVFVYQSSKWRDAEATVVSRGSDPGLAEIAIPGWTCTVPRSDLGLAFKQKVAGTDALHPSVVIDMESVSWHTAAVDQVVRLTPRGTAGLVVAFPRDGELLTFLSECAARDQRARDAEAPHVDQLA